MLRKLFNLKFWLPVLLLAAGGGALYGFMKSRPSAKKFERPFQGVVVKTVAAEIASPKIRIRTQGEVRVAQRVMLSSRRNGQVKWISPKLQAGRFFRKHEVLVKLDPLTGNARDRLLVKAPFDGVVQQRSTDIGQHVTASTALATLIGTDRAEVIADLPLSQLALLDIPASGHQKAWNLPAKLRLRIGKQETIWSATVQRQLPELTQQGRMVRLVLVVDDPFRLKQPKASAPVLLIGSFVEVEIEGRQLEEALRIPAVGLRNGNTVWLRAQRELQIRTVEVAHQDGDTVFLSSGIEADARVIISPLKGAADGLKVREAGRGPPRGQGDEEENDETGRRGHRGGFGRGG